MNTTIMTRPLPVGFPVTRQPQPVAGPPARVARSESETTLSLDLPGVELEDIDIELADVETREQALVVSWRRTEEGSTHGGERRWTLAGRFDLDSIEASSRNGVLRIRLPHAEPPARRTIQVTAAPAVAPALHAGAAEEVPDAA